MSEPSRLILLTNDDGINAAGLWALAEAVRDLGEVWIVAPERERSGVSHAFTLATPLRFAHHPRRGFNNVYAVSGTPVDAAKFALNRLLPRRPDLLLAGVNRGENSGINILYSGTVAGAMEGAMVGIPSIAVSIAWYDHDEETSVLDVAVKFTRRLSERVLRDGLPFGVMLNVNIPNLPADRIKGVRATSQTESHYKETIDCRSDPRGNEYFWISGVNTVVGDGDGGDMNAVREGYISVSPICPRLTDYTFLEVLKRWNLE